MRLFRGWRRNSTSLHASLRQRLSLFARCIQRFVPVAIGWKGFGMPRKKSQEDLSPAEQTAKEVKAELLRKIRTHEGAVFRFRRRHYFLLGGNFTRKMPRDGRRNSDWVSVLLEDLNIKELKELIVQVENKYGRTE